MKVGWAGCEGAGTRYGRGKVRGVIRLRGQGSDRARALPFNRDIRDYGEVPGGPGGSLTWMGW